MSGLLFFNIQVETMKRGDMIKAFNFAVFLAVPVAAAGACFLTYTMGLNKVRLFEPAICQ